MNPLAALFGAVASIFTGLFGAKEKQAEVIGQAVKVIGDVSASNASREQAIAQIIAAENSAGGLASIWRPMTMLVFLGLLLSFWFGYSPKNITGAMPPIIAEIFDIIKIGLAGYIPARTIEKIISNFNLAAVLKELIRK